MSDLNDTPQIPEESFEDQEASHPWIMLCTMTLLISGFVLASALMMNHMHQANAENGKAGTGFNLSAWVAKVKSMTVRAPAPKNEEPVAQSVEQPVAPAPSPLDHIKDIVSKAASSDKVRWPRLKLTGFGTSTDQSESFAIINGDQVHPGQIVDKVLVVEVRAHDVLVEYMGEQKTLTVNVQD